MKAAKLVVVLVLVVVLLHSMRGSYDHSLPQVLPFLGGKPPSRVYDVGGIAIILITLIGLRRLSRNREDDD